MPKIGLVLFAINYYNIVFKKVRSKWYCKLVYSFRILMSSNINILYINLP